MRLVLGAVGRLKDGAERTLFDRYWDRLAASGRAVGVAPLKLVEIPESREADAERRKAQEAARLLSAVEEGALVVALDEHGKSLSTVQFTDRLRRARDDGSRAMAFLVGGPDGHGDAVLKGARLTLSLSAMTLPHGLARVVLAEQLYRAATLLAGHPYHRH